MKEKFEAEKELLTREQGESIEEYRIRLCVMRKEGLISTSWEDIATLSQRDWGGDHMRKVATGVKETYDYYKEKELSLENEMNLEAVNKATIQRMIKERKKLEKATDKLMVEKVKLQSLRNSPNRLIREQGRSDLFMEELIQAVNESIPPVIQDIPARKKGDKEIIVSLADMHYGREVKIVDPLKRIINEYNVEIFEKRMWSLLSEIKALTWAEGLTHVHVLNLSDSIDGILRMSQLQSLQVGIVDGVIGFARFMIEWLRELSSFVDVDYYATLGNHNEIRPLGSKNGDFPHENTEYLITEIIRTGLAGNNSVRIHDCENFIYKEIAGYNILATHGQKERDLEKSVKDYMALFDLPIDMLITGHLHSSSDKTVGANATNNIETIQCPSLCGVDDYAIGIKKNAKAGAKVIILENSKTIKTTKDIILN